MLSKIYEECRSKYGWEDGEMQPLGIYEARDAIVKLINKHLPADCPLEAYGYDRPGVHNGALIFYRERGTTEIVELQEPDEVGDILFDAENSGELRILLKCEVIANDNPTP